MQGHNRGQDLGGCAAGAGGRPGTSPGRVGQPEVEVEVEVSWPSVAVTRRIRQAEVVLAGGEVSQAVGGRPRGSSSPVESCQRGSNLFDSITI